MIQEHKPVKRWKKTMFLALAALLVLAGLSAGAFAMDRLPAFAEGVPPAETETVPAAPQSTPAASQSVPLEAPAAEEGQAPELSWPLEGNTWLSACYSWRAHPITGARQLHSGVDIAVPEGTPIAAAAAGTVTEAGFAWDLGNYAVITHAGGLSTAYAHLASLQVEAGQTVAAGEQIGAVGKTGKATGPHLHFEVRVDGEAQDPVKYFNEGLSAVLFQKLFT